VIICRLASALILIILSGRAFATTVTESFTSNANKGSGAMVWNIARQELHPPLLVTGYDRGSGSESYPFSVGDGSLGAFTAEAHYRALSCATVTGSEISINTDACQDLQFTVFHLQSGWTIRPVGSKPLRIRSHSSVRVDGIIDCSGDNGTAATSSVITSVDGAIGRCGGGSGGTSVLPNVAPAAVNRGEAGGALVTGGGGGLVQSATGGVGGGGGGSYVKNFAGGSDSPDATGGRNDSAVAQANVGSNHRDDAFDDDIDGAGSGGGGGSGYELGMSAGNSSGASGGAGGGSILIYAVGDVNIVGSILADGGNGGSVTSPRRGGAGGGGAGGSILIMTVGDILIDNGTVSAQGGFGGSAFSTASGGNGDWGRTWLVEKDGYADFNGSPESPETKLNSPGDVRFETGVTYTVVSAAIDLGNSKPKMIDSVATVADLGASVLSYEISFGASSADASLSNHALPSTYAGTEVGRFGQFKIEIQNLDGLTPVRITEVNFEFDGFKQDEFEFAGTCASVGPILLGASGSGWGAGSGGAPRAVSENGSISLYLMLLSLPFLMSLAMKARLATAMAAACAHRADV
jgi:hypothetical protein